MAEAVAPCACEGSDFGAGEACGERAALRAERADTIAYLDRKIANATLMMKRSAEFAEEATAMRRAWQVARDDIAHGLHEGECLKGAAEADQPFLGDINHG